MGPEGVRAAIDAGDVEGLRALLREDRGLTTALVAAREIQPTSPLTYVGMVRFYGYAEHTSTGELARVLMEAGADKDDETRNGAPLYCAASHGDAEVVRALLEAGADVELTDPQTPEETALRAAAAFGWPEIVDALSRTRRRAALDHRCGRQRRPVRLRPDAALRARPCERAARRGGQRAPRRDRRPARSGHAARRGVGRPPGDPLGARAGSPEGRGASRGEALAPAGVVERERVAPGRVVAHAVDEVRHLGAASRPAAAAPRHTRAAPRRPPTGRRR